MSTFLQHHLFGLLEYRHVLGAIATSIDGLLVAIAAVDTADAELIAASMAGYGDEDYNVTTSEYGELHAVRGRDLQLIVLTEPGASDAGLRELMKGAILELEESVRV